MTEAATDPLAALKRTAALMCWVVALGGAAAELALAWIWLSPDLVARLVAPHVGLAGANLALDGWSRLGGFLVSMLPLSVLLLVLHQAYGLLDGYRRGHLFTLEAAERLRRVGLLMLVLAALRPLTVTLLSIVLTLASPGGERALVIAFSLDDLMIATFAGLVLAIGHVMAEAARLAEDSRLIV